MQGKVNRLRPSRLSNTVLCSLLTMVAACPAAQAAALRGAVTQAVTKAQAINTQTQPIDLPSNPNAAPIVPDMRPTFEFIVGGSLFNVKSTNGLLGVTPDQTDTLKQTNGGGWNSWGGQLGAGYAYYFHRGTYDAQKLNWFPAIEPQLNIYYNKIQNKGDVYLNGDGASNAYSYNMPIYSTRLMLDVALTIVSKNLYAAYVIGGIGNAWNTVSFVETNSGLNGMDLPTAHLNKKNASHFTWDLGLGATYDVSATSKLFLEYLYTDYGTLSVSGMDSNSFSPIYNPRFRLKTHAVVLGLHIGV